MKGSAKSGNAIAAENVRAEAAKCVDCKLIKGFCGKHITKLLEYEPRADLPIPPPPSSPPPTEMTAETLQLESKKCTDCKLVKGLCGKHITKFLEFEKRTGQAIVPPPPSSPPPPPSPPSSPTPMSAESLRSDINKCMECKVVKGLCSRHITKLIDYEKRTGTPALAVTPAFAIYATPKTSSKSSKASELVKIWEEKKKQLKLAQEKLRQKKAQEKEKQKRASQQADQAWSSTVSTSEQARKEKLQKDKSEREKKDQKDREEGKQERMKKEEKNPPQPTPPKEKGRMGFKFLQFTRKKEHEEEEKELQDEGAIDAEEARLNAELAKMSKKVKNFTQPSPTSPPQQSKSKPAPASSPPAATKQRTAPAPTEAPQSADDEYMLLMGITSHPVLSRMASSPSVGSVETLDSLDEQEYQAEMELRMLMEQEAALEAEVMRALQTK